MDESKSIAAQIYRHLPAKNCGKDDVSESPCGNRMCVEFAKKLLTNENIIEDCPYLEVKDAEAVAVLLETYFSRKE